MFTIKSMMYSTNDVHSHEMMTLVISVLENLFYYVTESKGILEPF